MKARGGASWLCGGGALAGGLARAQLIDELVLKLNPTTFGSGIPVFDRLDASVGWSLQGTERFDIGVVFLRYHLRRGAE